MFSRSEAIEVLKMHSVTIRDYKDFISIVGIKREYSINDLFEFVDEFGFDYDIPDCAENLIAS